MKKILWVLALLCLALTVASAEEIYAPTMEEIWTETTLEEFVGYWELTVVSSDKPVNMSTIRSLDIAEDGNGSVSIGDSHTFLSYDVTLPQPENGIVYLADENGENGAYYFLFDISLMGCVETLDNPGTIYYLTCYRYDEEESNAGREEAAAEILGYTEGAVPASAEQDIAGTWKCWSWTRDYGVSIMDPDMITMTMTIDGEQAAFASTMMGEENDIGAQVVASDTEVLLMTEDDETYYVFLRGEDELILLDDPELPTNALFFYTAEVWAQKEATGEFFTGVKLGEVAQLTSLDQVVGQWTVTHYNMFGYVQPVYNQDMGLEIAEDGTVIYHEEDGETTVDWAVSIQDNYLIVTDGEESADIYFMLYENDVLVQAHEGEDFSLAIYFQRSVEE